jgi:hypothetical protein
VSAVWLWAMAVLRGRARVTLLLAVLVGLTGGVVLAAVAGARRTDAALPRFVARDHAIDALVYPPEEFQPRDPLKWQLQELAALPEVAGATRVMSVFLTGLDQPAATDRRAVSAVVPMDPGGSRILGRPIVVAGRLPDERQPGEAAIDEELAARRHLGVGSIWRAGAYNPSQLHHEGELPSGPPKGPRVDLRIVGIVRRPIDLVGTVDRPDKLYGEGGDLYLTPAYGRRYGRASLARFGFIAVTLYRGQVDLSRLDQDARHRLGGATRVDPVDLGGITTDPAGVNLPGLRRAIALESGALLVFAGLAAIAGLLLVGQTLGRQIFLEAVEYPTLRALGMTRVQLVGAALVRAAAIGGGGAMIAAATAVALSPLAPIGLARRAEPHPGVALDRAVLTSGAVAVVAMVVVCAVAAAWSASRSPITALGVLEPSRARPPSRLAGALAAAGLPATAVIGARLALEPGRGRTAVPVRAAIAGAAAAVCALTAAAVLVASLTLLIGVPATRGWTWDVSVGYFANPQEAQQAATTLDANPDVDGYLGMLTDQLLAGSRPMEPGSNRVDILAIERGKSPVPLQVVEGREPVGPDEIALGSTTMRELGKRIGDRLDADLEVGPTVHLRIVGRVVLNAGPLDPAITPGKGGVVDLEMLRRVYPEVCPAVYLVRLDPAAHRTQAVAALRRTFPGTVVDPAQHPDIKNLSRVKYLPGLLATVMAVLALSTMIHTLASSIRRRRRDLAILKTLGLLPRQISATVTWQATTFATAAVLAGIPLGVAAGRWTWQLVAVQLGVLYEPVLPLLQVLVIAAGTLVAAILVAVGPAWVAGHIPPATVLRSE